MQNTSIRPVMLYSDVLNNFSFTDGGKYMCIIGFTKFDLLKLLKNDMRLTSHILFYLNLFNKSNNT